MELFPPEIRRLIPGFRRDDDSPGGRALAIIKYFTPDSHWTWHATEACAIVKHADESTTEEPADYTGDGDIVDHMFFGLVQGFEKELGYFCLSELRQSRGALGLPIERDLHWRPASLDTIAPELFNLSAEPAP